MKYFIILVVSLLLCSDSRSQTQAALDSMMLEIPSKHDTLQIVEYTKVLSRYFYMNLDSAQSVINVLERVVDAYGDPKYKAHLLNLKAIYAQSTGDNPLSIKYWRKSIAMYREIGNRERESALLNNISGYYRRTGKLDSALLLQMQSLDIKKELGLTGVEMAATYWNIGNAQSDVVEYIISNEWYRKAEKIYAEVEDEQSLYGVRYLIALNLQLMDSLDKAMPVFEEVIEYDRRTNQLNNLAGDLDNLGTIALNLGNYEEAEDYLLEALELGLANGERTLPGFVYRRLSQLYLKTKEYEKAMKYAQLSLANAEEFKQDKKKVSDYLVLSQVYDSLNICGPALSNFKQYHALYDSILGVEKLAAMSELQIKYETEKKEQEIKLLEEKAKTSKMKQRGMLGGFIALGALAVSLIFGLRQRLRKNQLEKEKSDQELEFSQKELEAKKQELTAFALQLANKNETLESIKRNVQDVRTNSDDRRSIQSIVNTIDFNINDDNNWETFRLRFDAVHKGFETNVKSKFNAVTPNELRLMALLKMNLSSKEIANILNVSGEGIKKARYRLRKKLELQTSDSLEETVMSL